MTITETMAWINAIPYTKRTPGLHRIGRLLHYMGNPQKKLKFIHVAGTNGKGSTCAMTASVLRSAGYKTGMFISPFIVEFRERMQINGQMIPEETLCALVERIQPEYARMQCEGEEPSEFEVVTAVGLCWFAAEECDAVVLEVGMGGLLDATNIIDTPLASVICTLDYDHTQTLGETLPEIAAHKAGIIKENGLTVSYPQPAEVRQVIEQNAAEKHNVCIFADPGEIRVLQQDLSGTELVFDGQTYHLPLLGDHQVRNAATVLTLFRALTQTGRLHVPPESIRQGIAEVTFPVRLEIVGRAPVILLDGAHNPSGIEALCAAVRKYLPGGPRIAVVGMMRDKDYETAVAPMAKLFSRILTVTPDSPRALPAPELAAVFRNMGGKAEACATPLTALNEARRMAGCDGAVVVCGSLYLASELRRYMAI